MAYFDGVKAGDKVWDFIYGWGEVIGVFKNDRFPIIVRFKDIVNKYSKSGRAREAANQTLFWG